jgi:photosystem I P700 chlorophyll a apoprotein A2
MLLNTCSLPPYAFLAQDFTTQASLYTHHILQVSSYVVLFLHGAIFFIRDYDRS